MRASRREGRAPPGLVARARACGKRRQEQFSDRLLENGQVRDFFGSLSEHVAAHLLQDSQDEGFVIP